MPLGIAFNSFLISILCPFNVNAESTSNSTLSLAFGNGFVDIAALTTLIGSSAAESLLLGDRGFGGLAWAAISAFGALFVIKACVTGASASWLRVTLGVRNVVSDEALGTALSLERGRNNDEKARRNLGEALGIICKNVARKTVTSAETFRESTTVCRDVYAFDRSTLNLVCHNRSDYQRHGYGSGRRSHSYQRGLDAWLHV
ncbi:hypothetical protein PILCRDRAFT_825804 [Piloderma croceum F 1598]|uniref:Uncharacterized protein n=1 Tax=Piloderma croceum (strain F 1598) TaxID=765440 RepID=A0A0C3FBG6_PILCF|nr:hypothetical protein PILCRDRAFT_825804 [Piloderma croceum F 1598]